jgi:hypothetical protein
MVLLHRKTNGKRRVPKEKRRAIVGIKELSLDAPARNYCVDIVAEELFAKSETAGWLSAFVREIREGINAAAISALEIDRDRLRHPQRFFRTKRFFEDVKLIQKLIERNKNVDRTDLLLTTRHFLNKDYPLQFPKVPHHEIDDLIASLPRMADAIAVFLGRRKPRGKPGHHDPLTRAFIDEVFDLWSKRYWAEESADENGLFSRLLVAAWRDVNLPTREEDGQSLKERLADRVRKQFPDGICRTRMGVQSEMLYRHWLGMNDPPSLKWYDLK